MAPLPFTGTAILQSLQLTQTFPVWAAAINGSSSNPDLRFLTTDALAEIFTEADRHAIFVEKFHTDEPTLFNRHSEQHSTVLWDSLQSVFT